MRDKIENKKIIITGSSGGLGEKIAWHIAKNGGIPIMLARSIDKLENVQRKMKQELDANSFVYQVDLMNEKLLVHTFDRILIEHEKVHGLINNAGLGIFDFVNDLDWKDIDRMFQLNVYALIQATKIVLPHFVDLKGNCHIINIASQAGKIATPKSAVYAATKHAVLGFTNSLRLELANERVFVTAVNLGPVQTDFFKLADPFGTYQANIGKYMLDPDDVAKKIVANLFRQKREINLPWWMDMGSRFYHLFPKTMEVLLHKQFNKK
ncbi:SDR family NAD(P)-dependent oxidoreductase [Ornithinibacillus salinisoli]|uniref:SDR family NAD(P)-dependent oxidoreductase n=1 Tax=Ornithinibacillus salinisoli TaxID=1848459 RepID=A0ABW4W494_9BACI